MWFKVDDKLHGHRKPRAAGKAAMGVWVLAGSWAADHLTDGFVPAALLPMWGTRGDAKRLVDAGLWTAHTNEHGEKGWLFHNWAEFQPSSEAVEADRAKARHRMSRLRSGERSPEQSENVPENFNRSSATPSRPDPNVVTSSGQSGWLVRALDGLTDDDVSRISEHLRCSHTHARTVARDVLTRSQTPVARPVSYVIAAVDAEPHRYRPTVQPPTKTTCCPQPGHGSYPAHACGACRSEQLTGGA